MTRFSAAWVISTFLKFVAIYVLIGTILGVGTFATGTRDPVIYHWMGTEFRVTPLVHFLTNASWHVLTGLAHSVILWFAGDIMLAVIKTEEYTRGIYNALRKRAEKKTDNLVKNTEQRSVRTAAEAFAALDNQIESDNLQYSPPARYRQQKEARTAPMRRVTVFRDRTPHSERPAPQTRDPIVTDDWSDGRVGGKSGLPFDEV